ncbi:ATP-binding protein [Eisenbergiella tayi]|uniref:ATP-binding protein n=1 Tax=Eisenbergiella tayi TaxID=1432052 RepID=UPI00021342B6|nr:ATP-binding protein [Eisenbergiella tayi]EGN33783.1 hypothetical protein HMPREF0994_04988 [Lachnospiraceae bacterium 3_1_57FAA_CT1]
MDKYEYKIRAEEIKTLISQKKYVDAAKVADTIDWTRVKSVMMLCTVSDLYKVNRRFEDAKLLLEMANERHPAGRMIIYSLCDLSIKMGEVVQAVEYYKDFTQIAPNDSGRYVLQYKLYEAQDVGLEERIAVLEELKKRDYREKWAYELAYLYHRVGLATKCVEECDELILWFGEGKYVMKAMELKMLHQPLSPAQQQKYEAYMMRKQGLRVPEPEDKQDKNSEGRKKAEEDDIHVKPMDVGKYNTINLQKELAKSMEELMLNGRQPAGDQVSLQEYRDQMAGQENSYADQSYDIEAEDTGEMIPQEYDPAQYGEETYTYEDLPAAAGPEYPEAQMQPEAAAAPQPDYYAVKEEPAAAVQEPVQESSGNPDPDLSNYLSQEYDGQIGLVVPDGYQVERQITGQMNIEDIMKEWEKMKLENEEKRRRQLQQRVMEQTDSLFRDFDKTARKGVLERLQKEERIPVERRRPPENNVISAHTKIWAAEEVENAMKRTEGAAAAVTAAAVVSAAAGVVPEAGMKELSGTAGRTAEEAAQPVPAPAVSQPVPAVPEAEPVYEEPSVPEPVPAVSRTADPIPEEEPEDRQPAYIEEPEDAAYEPEPEMDEDAGPEPEEDLENTQEMNARLEEERLEKEIRSMSREEKQLFASFVPTRGAMKKLVRALDQLSLAAYTGNLIITGDPGSDTLNLAKNIVKDVRAKDHNFSGKLAKIEGDAFNKKDAGELVVKLAGGALVIDNAGEIDDEGAGRLMDALNQEQTGILVILIDTKRNIKKLISANPEMESFFNARFDIEALDNGTLVAYGCQYAKMQEYAIDELGRLALHTRIEDMQTSDHIVTVNDVRDIVDEAIDHANRKTPKHFMDVLLAKRYDDDDMIILHEGDFI